MDINTFELGTHDERARKVCEESTELYAAWSLADMTEFDGDSMYNLRMEIGDVLTSCVNFATALGIDVQDCIDLVETKNIIRGRYD